MTDSSIVSFEYATKTQDIGFVVEHPSQPDAVRLHLTPVNWVQWKWTMGCIGISIYESVVSKYIPYFNSIWLYTHVSYWKLIENLLWFWSQRSHPCNFKLMKKLPVILEPKIKTHVIRSSRTILWCCSQDPHRASSFYVWRKNEKKLKSRKCCWCKNLSICIKTRPDLVELQLQCEGS